MAGNASLRLLPHSRIGIVGGGPAGSIFALNMLRSAAEIHLPVDITIFERKDLSAAGPRGCNMCAGILSSRLVHGLANIGIQLPPELILARVRVYQLHWREYAVDIFPPDPSRQVLSVYRAGGPRKSPFAPTSGLDEFLLQRAVELGATLVHERVQEIDFRGQPQISTANRTEAFDLVVLATGVNASPPIVKNLTFVPPKTEMMAQDSLLISTDRTRARMAGTVHVYFDQPRNLIFGALVPKGNFATISLLGRRLERNSLSDLLAEPQVQEVIGAEPPQMCGCRPLVAISRARNAYSDRFVAVGDSCVTRLYKDGLGSAFVTACAASNTALYHGVSRSDFATHYEPVCRSISSDNRFGRLVFRLISRSKRNAILMKALARALESETHASPEKRVFSRTLWSLFTGDANYAEISRMLLDPRSITLLTKSILSTIRSQVHL